MKDLFIPNGRVAPPHRRGRLAIRVATGRGRPPSSRELTRPWQYAVLAGALVMVLPLRRGVVLTLLSAAAIGVAVALAAGTVSP
jgi:hypothetical protein